MRHFLILALIGLVVLFTVQNIQSVEITFLFWTFETRRAILVFLLLVVGFAIGWIVRGVPGGDSRNTSRGPSNLTGTGKRVP